MSKFTIVRSEEEVGITRRLGAHQRFQGVFKGRFSDFHVNEIDLTGKIVQLTNLEAPVQNSSGVAVDDAEICSWIPKEVRENVQDFQMRLEDGRRKNLHRSDPLWKEKVQIEVTSLSKDERTKIHKWLANYDKLSSLTIDKDGKKYIDALFQTKKTRDDRRPACRGRYTHCTLFKEGVDTFEAIGHISKNLRIKQSLITFCGTKDKHGKTTQRISISNIAAERLVNISKNAKSLKLGNYEYLPHHLRLGDLQGNHFKILLKNVIASSDESISTGVDSLKTFGFINYFGLQRFGSYKISTHTIGISLLQMKWLEAFDLILVPKPNDADFMKKAKDEWFTNRDPNAAIKYFPHWHRSIESNLLHGLAKYYGKNDLIGSYLRIPRNSRNLYIHSFQSFLWNKVASYRIQELGTEPVVGDIVYADKDQIDFCVEDANELDEVEDEVEPNNDDQNSSNRSLSRLNVKILTSEDIPNYTIYDVLIPIQGSQIKIPENQVKQYYDSLLKEQGLDEDCFLKFKISSDQPKGAYRKLMVRPQNVSYRIIRYNDSDPVDTFIPSEIDKLNEQKLQSEESCTKPCDKQDTVGIEKPQETVKDKKCVVVEFSLPSSSYATMALRELMISDAESIPTRSTLENIDDKTSTEVAEADCEPLAKRRRENNE